MAKHVVTPCGETALEASHEPESVLRAKAMIGQ